jgi:tripartite-type tricarboxylate transporter receptor subunit TctC
MFADILGGRIDGVLSSALFSISFIKAGKVRPIAAGGTTRCQLYPEVPTIAEAGYPGIEVPYGLGLFVARDTPAPIVAQLNRDMANALHAPAMKARFADEGVTVGTLTPDQFRERVEREVKVIDQVIKRNKLKLDVGSHVPTPESSHFA